MVNRSFVAKYRINEGKPIVNSSKIAAKVLPMGTHVDFQVPDAF